MTYTDIHGLFYTKPHTLKPISSKHKSNPNPQFKLKASSNL